MKKENYKCGTFVISGFPNAGKSTLLNQIKKKKIAIVSSKVQTTRDEISGVININKTQLIFTDTPGIVEKKKYNEKRISRVLLNKELNVDYNLFVYDLKRDINKKLITSISKITKKFKKNYLILNKIDLIENKRFFEISKKLNSEINFLETFMISAKKNQGIAYLIEKLKLKAPKRKWLFDENIVIDKNLNFQISEITREKIFHLLNKEIPYSVEVNTKINNTSKIVVIDQIIYVKKKSQKSIIIGQNGKKIKMIGSRSRVEIEKLIKKKIFLNLLVKVKEKK